MMRFRIALLLAFCMLGSACYAQMTMSEKGVTFPQFFKEIMKQTTYKFIYNNNMLPRDWRFDVNVKNTPVPLVLDTYLRPAQLTYEIRPNNEIVIQQLKKEMPAPVQAPAQHNQIEGQVVDDNGRPLPGATIAVKGTHIGVLSGASGNFNLQLPDTKDAVIVSFVGYRPQELAPWTGSKTIQLQTLPTAVKEVTITTGMFNGNRTTFSGAVSSFTGKDFYFNLTVSAPSYEGWLLLCDMENGNSRLDIISHRGNADTVYTDILKIMSSAYIATGIPAFVETGYSMYPSPPANGTVAIYVGTSKNAVALGPDTLEYNPSYDLGMAMNPAPPVTNWAGSQFYLGVYGGLLYADKNVYHFDQGYIEGPVNNKTDGTPFTPSRWAAINKSSWVPTGVLYDTDKGAFYRYPGSGTSCVPFNNGTLFDFNTGKDLLYMEYVPFNSGEVFAVLQDHTNGKKFLARFTFKGQQNYYGEIVGEGIAGATQFAASPDKGYLFYCVGGKVYEYDAVANRSILMKDYGNRSISLMKFQRFNSISDFNLNAVRYIALSRKLVVCTYMKGAPATSGMMDIYDVPDINAPLQLYQSFSGGIGKVVSMAYRDR
ncbi:carboxypeptidase-like regulatory domain-containing protein [Chitinophaga sp. 212800010-3]|uniref:carboxypeptidase-like regulatory domain-containing protein n=1 Tax=unclassified Chitinophaga TaxID=2619133 RepID=UPI002DED99A2|nr:hypothetical protein [Chitinophaga sp. 212800010-3]